MMKRTLSTVAAAAFAMSMMAGPAFAGPVQAPADGACVAAGVKVLGGAIGTVAPAAGPGAVAGVIIDHTNGIGTLSGVKC